MFKCNGHNGQMRLITELGCHQSNNKQTPRNEKVDQRQKSLKTVGCMEGREVIGPRTYVVAQTLCEQVSSTSDLQIRISESKDWRILSNTNKRKELPPMFIGCFILHSYQMQLL